MAITAISRDWGVNPSIVRITDSANFAAITATGYITTQLENIKALQNGVFEWKVGDMILIYYADGEGFFTYNSTTFSLIAAPTLSNTLADGRVFVGNASNIASAVSMSGDATIINTGALTIANSAITNAKVAAAAAIDFSKLAAMTSGNILVGSAGTVPTSVAMSGDATIVASGALTIANNAITNVKVDAAAAIDFSKLATLSSANILVGSAGNVATSVAVTGDVTISNAGVTTIGVASIDLAMLSAGITPSHVVKFAGKQADGGGSATVAITVTGALSTDVVFAQVEASTNPVSVQKATPTADTVTVLFSGDPGAATIISYQVLRAAV